MDTRRIVVIGGGAAGLSAAYTLKKHGFDPLLLEADDYVGGRMRGEKVDGFSIDTGADFFCSSYDVTFQLCEELDLSLIRSKMKLGWFRNGRWVTSTPGHSPLDLIRNLPTFSALGFLSPRAMRSVFKLFREIVREQKHLNFASDSRIAELDSDENFRDYLNRLGVPEELQTTFRGFLEMTMGHVEFSGQAYMRTYLAEMLLNAHKLYVPEKGASSLAEKLADNLADAIRLSTPVKSVTIQNGGGEDRIRVDLDDGVIYADAVICAIPPTKVPEIIPQLPQNIRNTLANITYSSGCRVVIGLEHPPLPEGWNGALYPEDDTPLLLDRSINLPSCAPPGKSTLDMLVGRERAKELIPLDDDEIKRQMLRNVRKSPPPGSNLPDDDAGIFTRVYRWEQAVCMGPPRMFTDVAEIQHQINRDTKNLFLAGDYTRVPSVNGALASGVIAAEQAIDLFAASPA